MSVKDPVVTTWHLKVNNSHVRTQPATQTKSITPLRSDKQNNMISKNLMQAEEKQDPRAPLLYTAAIELLCSWLLYHLSGQWRWRYLSKTNENNDVWGCSDTL